MKNRSRNDTQTITVAKLCEALANGTLSAVLEDGMYVIRHRDLLRLAHAHALQLPIAIRTAHSSLQKAS